MVYKDEDPTNHGFWYPLELESEILMFMWSVGPLEAPVSKDRSRLHAAPATGPGGSPRPAGHLGLL